jgi:hypothetical protein
MRRLQAVYVIDHYAAEGGEDIKVYLCEDAQLWLNERGDVEVWAVDETGRRRRAGTYPRHTLAYYEDYVQTPEEEREEREAMLTECDRWLKTTEPPVVISGSRPWWQWLMPWRWTW